MMVALKKIPVELELHVSQLGTELLARNPESGGRQPCDRDPCDAALGGPGDGQIVHEGRSAERRPAAGFLAARRDG